jgi:hypothetical protein
MTTFTDIKIAKGFKALDRDELLDRIAEGITDCTQADGALWAVHYNNGGVYFLCRAAQTLANPLPSV